MGDIRQVVPVKLFCGLIFVADQPFAPIEKKLCNLFGDIDYDAGPMPFDFTDYYEKEMGCNLKRRFIAFKNLINPEMLADVKLATNRIEQELGELTVDGLKRRVNIDPGYVTPAKTVLATTKDFSHRIYLRDGIYAEVTLNFRKGACSCMEWTYPDFKTKEYHQFFLGVRRLLTATIERHEKETI
ncbi:MAG: DUF4416 family protein [Lentisphaerae bacterium]|nr:DUF4416 family protein [Lentisphaerota bacterium]